jgi:hypothetical protein
LLYLDQWALSGMARDEKGFDRLLNRLREEVKSGRVICPASWEHRSESVLAEAELWHALDEMAGELSLGIRFLPGHEIEHREITAAVALFCAEEAEYACWQEAFNTDPQTDLGERFTEFLGGEVRVRAVIPPSDLEQEDAVRQKAIANRMDAAYQTLREAGYSFEKIAEDNLEQMLGWKLGPLLDFPEFERSLKDTQARMADEPSRSLYNKTLNLAARLHMAAALLERYPALRRCLSELRAFEPLRSMPTLRYPALLRAALATARNRKAQPGDEFDVEHLTRGLSRCDIVTVDTAMAHVVRERKLIPSSCMLVSGREGPDGIQQALDAWLE